MDKKILDAKTLEQALALMYREHFKGRAAASTVEALMYSLRTRGVAALKEAPAQRRLGQCSEQQLCEISARLRKLKPHVAKAWTSGEVDQLLETWADLHG